MARFWKYCPICLRMRIARDEVRTCGSADCLAVWRTLTPTQKGYAIEKAQQLKADTEIAEITGGLITRAASSPEEAFKHVPEPKSPPTPEPEEEDFLAKHYGIKDKK